LCIRHHFRGSHSGLGADRSVGVGLPNEELCPVFYSADGRTATRAGTLGIEDRTLIFARHRTDCGSRGRSAGSGDRPRASREVTSCTKSFGEENCRDSGVSETYPAKGEITLLIGAPEPGEAGTRFDTAQSLAARVDERSTRRNWIAGRR
jgi:hypothetical protein